MVGFVINKWLFVGQTAVGMLLYMLTTSAQPYTGPSAAKNYGGSLLLANLAAGCAGYYASQFIATKRDPLASIIDTVNSASNTAMETSSGVGMTKTLYLLLKQATGKSGLTGAELAKTVAVNTPVAALLNPMLLATPAVAAVALYLLEKALKDKKRSMLNMMGSHFKSEELFCDLNDISNTADDRLIPMILSMIQLYEQPWTAVSVAVSYAMEYLGKGKVDISKHLIVTAGANPMLTILLSLGTAMSPLATQGLDSAPTWAQLPATLLEGLRQATTGMAAWVAASVKSSLAYVRDCLFMLAAACVTRAGEALSTGAMNGIKRRLRWPLTLLVKDDFEEQPRQLVPLNHCGRESRTRIEAAATACMANVRAWRHGAPVKERLTIEALGAVLPKEGTTITHDTIRRGDEALQLIDSEVVVNGTLAFTEQLGSWKRHHDTPITRELMEPLEYSVELQQPAAHYAPSGYWVPGSAGALRGTTYHGDAGSNVVTCRACNTCAAWELEGQMWSRTCARHVDVPGTRCNVCYGPAKTDGQCAKAKCGGIGEVGHDSTLRETIRNFIGSLWAREHTAPPPQTTHESPRLWMTGFTSYERTGETLQATTRANTNDTQHPNSEEVTRLMTSLDQLNLTRDQKLAGRPQGVVANDDSWS